MNPQKNIRLLDLYTASLNMLFCLPVIIPYYRDRIGLSFQDFLIGEAVFAAIVVALEVPSGWLSDVWRRKNVLVLSAVLYMAGMGLLLAARDLATAVFAQSVLGVAVSLFSGTNSALLYDSLLAESREKEYSRLEGRRQGYGFYVLALASLFGGFLYEIHPDLPVILSAAAAAPAILCACLMLEPPRCKSAIEHHPLADMAFTLRYALHGHAEIAFIIFFSAILFSATKLMMWTQQPYYMELSVPELYFGILMAMGYALAGISSHLAHRLDRKISNIRALAFAVIAGIAICAASAQGPGWHGVALLIFGGSFLYGLTLPRVNDAINKRVGSERRAAILSTVSMLYQLFFIPLSFLIGYLTVQNGISGGLYGIAGWLLLAGLTITAWAFVRKSKPQGRS